MKLPISVAILLATQFAHARAPQINVQVVSVEPFQNVVDGMKRQALLTEFGAIVEMSLPVIEKMGVNQQLGSLTVDGYKAAIARASVNVAASGPGTQVSVDKNTGSISPGDWLEYSPDQQVAIAVGQLARLAGANDKDAETVAVAVSKELGPQISAAISH